MYEVAIDKETGLPVMDNSFARVVRCKDCIHYYADPWGYGNCVFEGGVSRRTKESDFCSWGEREEVETGNTYSIGKIELPKGVFRQIYDEERREDGRGDR